MKKLISVLLVCLVLVAAVLPIALSPTPAAAIDFCLCCEHGSAPCCPLCWIQMWWRSMSDDGWWDW